MIVPAEVQRGQRREQERDRQHDPEVEQVDEAVERVAGAVLAVAGVGGDGDHVVPPAGRGSLMTAARYWRSDRSWLYMRSRESDSPNATAPISRPTTVTLNATRRSWLSCGGVAGGQAGQRRRERDQRAHQPERGPGADEHPRAGQAALGVEVEVGERLVELMVAPVGSGVLDDEGERRRHRRAARDRR